MIGPLLSEADRSWLLEIAAVACCTVVLVGLVTVSSVAFKYDEVDE